jgi:hypothetical protein
VFEAYLVKELVCLVAGTLPLHSSQNASVGLLHPVRFLKRTGFSLHRALIDLWSYIGANALPGYSVVAAVCGSPSSEPWHEVWRSIIFPCFPPTRPPLPKPNSIIIADFHLSAIPPLPCVLRPPKFLGMPYTPPSHCSPPPSAANSPDVSRRPSFNSSPTAQPKPRPTLPRSASYLTRHRRSLSAVTPSTVSTINHGSTADMKPSGTMEGLGIMTDAHPANVRQSPPPITDGKAMPAQAIISPPESSSEDEGTSGRDNIARDLKELKEAVIAITQDRVGSPNTTPPSNRLASPAPMDRFPETASTPTVCTTGLKAGRTGSHTRSKTDIDLYLEEAVQRHLNGSDDSSELDEPVHKPPMLRKKSGELVRPALRPASLRRPSSMPGTPTFSKAVHFDSHLEHVRHFLQLDRPLAVSTSSSPVDHYDSDTEYPFKVATKSEASSPSYEWEIVMNNFPAETSIRKGLAVRLQRVWMSTDQKSLIGSVSVANLAFHKSVVCRFTFDYWKTTSEVGAEFHHEIREAGSETGHDQFQFSIKLSDMANLETKTLYFCMKYNVNGLEFWDNNDSMNFQVDFRKKPLSRNGNKNAQGASSRPANALPRSNRRSNPSTATRPKSMPVGSLDEFGRAPKLTNPDGPTYEFLGESYPSAVRLKSSKSTTSLPSDNLPGRLPVPSGAAFANRYDFGASLSAAKQAQKSPNSSPRQTDALYMKMHQRNAVGPSTPAEVPRSQSGVTQTGSLVVHQSPRSQTYVAAPPSPGNISPSTTSIASASYEEILNKYCFFNSSKQSGSRTKGGASRDGQYDGMDDFSPLGSTTTHYSLSGIHGNINESYQASGSSFDAPHHDPMVSNRSPNPTRMNTAAGNHVTASSPTSDGPLAAQIQYRHISQMRDRSPFSSASRPPTAISC